MDEEIGACIDRGEVGLVRCWKPQPTAAWGCTSPWRTEPRSAAMADRTVNGHQAEKSPHIGLSTGRGQGNENKAAGGVWVLLKERMGLLLLPNGVGLAIPECRAGPRNSKSIAWSRLSKLPGHPGQATSYFFMLPTKQPWGRSQGGPRPGME
jgi:hypothetical protein